MPGESVPVCPCKYDAIIVGAGPHALAALSALHDPLASLRADQVSRRRCRRHVAPRVAVVDPAGAWLSKWDEQFEELDIKVLRSPVMAHPDPFESASLLTFASRHGEAGVLRNVDVDGKRPRRLDEVSDLYSRPSTRCFHDFCGHLAERSKHTFVQGLATEIQTPDETDDELYHVEVDGPTPMILLGHEVIVAVGRPWAPRIPDAMAPIRDAFPHLVRHSGELAGAGRAAGPEETVLVVGGGSSALNAAVMLGRRGARTLVYSRRPLAERHFDLSLDWVFANTATKKRADFLALPLSERLEHIRKARGSATVQPDLVAEAAALGVEMHCGVGEILGARVDADTGRVHVELDGQELVADWVLLATGHAVDMARSPVLAGLAERLDLPSVDGLPDLDAELRWGDSGVFVMGAFASLQLGPDALSLFGAQRGARIIAEALKGDAAPLSADSNPFALLGDD